jgi:hypothetical protein
MKKIFMSNNKQRIISSLKDFQIHYQVAIFSVKLVVLSKKNDISAFRKNGAS